MLELHNIEEVVTQHVPGKLNDVADKLSRLAQLGVSQQLTPQLQGAERRVTPKRDDLFFPFVGSSSWPGKTCTTSNRIATISQNKWSKPRVRVCSPFCFFAKPCAETPAQSSVLCTCYLQLTLWLNFKFCQVASTALAPIQIYCVPCDLAFLNVSASCFNAWSEGKSRHRQ